MLLFALSPNKVPNCIGELLVDLKVSVGLLLPHWLRCYFAAIITIAQPPSLDGWMLEEIASFVLVSSLVVTLHRVPIVQKRSVSSTISFNG